MPDIAAHLIEMKRLLTRAEVLARTPGYNLLPLRDTVSELRSAANLAVDTANDEIYTARLGGKLKP